VTTPVRTAGKFGRKPAQFPAALHDLTHYVAGSLPKAPASMAVPEVSTWEMLGNDTYGDCGVAGLEHLLMAAAADTGEQETFASDQQAVDYYLKYTGGVDEGVVLSEYLTYVRRHGYYGKTVKAFAPVSVHDLPSLQTAMWLYDGVYTGIAVTQAMMNAFGQGQPWTLEMAQQEQIGGHCIPLIGFDGKYVYAVTWGGVQAIEYPAWHAMSSEAWAVISGELGNGDGHGIDLAALKADLDKLDVPAPSAPTVHKSLLAEVADLVRLVAASADKDISEVVAWLASHGL
jgi:hypothetical protein